jgi:hypothetical protein
MAFAGVDCMDRAKDIFAGYLVTHSLLDGFVERILIFTRIRPVSGIPNPDQSLNVDQVARSQSCPVHLLKEIAEKSLNQQVVFPG